MTNIPSPARMDRAVLARQIQALVRRLHPTVTFERRRNDRLSIPISLRLTPLADDGRPISGETINVIGKNISRYGLSFYHAAPLTFRRARVTVENAEFAPFAAEIDISWCRFTKPGWYESGGRLIAPLMTELDPSNPRRENSDDRFIGPASNRRTA